MKKIYIVPVIKVRGISEISPLCSSVASDNNVTTGGVVGNESGNGGVDVGGTQIVYSKGNSFGEWEDDEVVEK